MVYDELRKSPAYTELPPSVRLVLFEMLAAYGRASKATEGYTPNGFQFTLGRCRERCSRNGFYKAVKMIVEHGFFDTPAELQPGSALMPRRFVPSHKWTTFAKNDKTKRAEAAKARTLARNEKRKLAHLAAKETE